jgi:hypothetical protein
MTIPLSSIWSSHILVLTTSGYEILYVLYEWLYLSPASVLVIFSIDHKWFWSTLRSVWMTIPLSSIWSSHILVLTTSGYELLYVLYEWPYLSAPSGLLMFSIDHKWFWSPLCSVWLTIPLSSIWSSHILVLTTSGYEILYVLYEWPYHSPAASLVTF